MALCDSGSTVVVECDESGCTCEVAMDLEDVRTARRFADGIQCGCRH